MLRSVLLRVRVFRLCSVLVWPLALLFVYPLSLLKKKNPGSLFFFFDRYCIGGAQGVFLGILSAVEDAPKQLYFTRRPADAGLKHLFYSVPNAEIREIDFWTCNPLLRFFAVHFYASYINRHKGARVFGSNSTFFYDMVPFLSRKVRSIELFHNFQNYGNHGFQFYGLATCRHLDVRVVVDRFTVENIREQYERHGVPSEYFRRVAMIEPAADIPPDFEKDLSPPLKVLYAGRGGRQKRVWLLNRIVEHFIPMGLPIEFHFAGTMTDELSPMARHAAIVHGEIGKRAEMQALYAAAHVVILVSGFEGFPMVVKEGMASGCVPVVTALPGYRMHLRDHENALLIDAVDDEDAVVRLAIAQLEELISDPGLVVRLSTNARQYASRNFGMEAFRAKYRELLLDSPARSDRM